MLRNFYINKGYYQVKIVNTSAKFHDTNKFDLVFNINAGNKYYFGFDSQSIKVSKSNIDKNKVFPTKL